MIKRKITKRVGWQLMMAGVLMALVLISLRSFLLLHTVWAAGAASLASTIYIMFTHPGATPAKPKNIICCYLLAFFLGAALHELAAIILDSAGIHVPYLLRIYLHDFMGALAIILLLVTSFLFEVPHPPAAGMALALTFDVNNMTLAVMLLVWVFLLAGCKHLLRERLVNVWD